MKRFFLLVLSLILFGCSDNSSSITDAEKEQALKKGQSYSAIVLQNFMQKLMEALAKDPVYAVDFCSEQAMVITQEIEKDKLPMGVKIKRIAKKNRNLQNFPTEAENTIFNYFEHSIEEDKLAEERVVKTIQDDKVIFEYYRPILTARICLTCHGSLEQIDSKIKEVLSKKYPDDKATGFKEGQLRGLLKIAFPADEN